MRINILASAALLAIVALPAAADGYRDAPPPNRGPAPLAPHEAHDYHHKKDVRVVRVRREVAAPQAVHSGCGCCCAPVSYSRSYITEPVIVRTYTRTYTRTAPPSCGHYTVYQGDGYSGTPHHEDHHRSHGYQEGRYHEGRYAHESWQHERERYRGPHGDAPDYGENRITWSGDDGRRDNFDYTARRDGYSYYQARHD